MKKRNKPLEIIKQNKKEIIMVGVSIITIAGITVIIKNSNLKSVKDTAVVFDGGNNLRKTSMIKVTEPIGDSVIKPNFDKKKIDVGRHIRNLPDGWTASTRKLESAIEIGILLDSNQTWVDNYTRLSA